MKRLIRLILPGMLAAVSGACSLSSLVDGAEVSSELKDPAVVRTPQGAISVYRGAQIAFATAVSFSTNTSTSGMVYVSGLLADELQARNLAADFPTTEDAFIDSRIRAGTPSNDVYGELHKVRALANEARGLVREFVPGEWRDMYAHLYAIEAYTNIFLADLFCSGVPLTQVDYKGDYTVTRGYTTAEVYQNALTLFDSAEAYVRDSTNLIHFINVGRGRALIAIGQYAQAAAAVKNIPNAYRYDIPYSASFAKAVPRPNYMYVADGDGNGIQFMSDHDPRATLPMLLDQAAPLTLASGLEARLIAIELAIHNDDADWITRLNALRTTCTTPESCPVPAPPGIGNVGDLPPLIDSASSLPAEERLAWRLDILFRERAYWLFLTGHRQGDLRRLVREYGRHEQTAYPSGLWGTKGFTAYGTRTNFVIPEGEFGNTLYNGCIHNEA